MLSIDWFSLCFYMLLMVDNFVFDLFVGSSNGFFRFIVIFMNVFGVDIDEAGFADDSLCFFGLFIRKV